MKKKMLAWLLALAMVFTSMPMTADATDVDPNSVVTEDDTNVEEQSEVSKEDSEGAEEIDAQNEDSEDVEEEIDALNDGEQETGDGTSTTNEWYDANAENYEIASKEELLAFAEAVNDGANFAGKVVKLTADIELVGEEWSPIGGDSVYFAGEFDGQGHTISNLTQTAGARMGLFGLVEKSYIHDLTLEDVNFTVTENDARVGAIAGNLQYWNVVENVTIDGINITLNGNDGLVGTVTGYAWKSQLGNVDVKDAVFTVNGTGNVIGGHTAYGRAHVWDTNVTGNNEHWLEGTVQTIDGTEYVLQNYFVDCDVDGIKMTLNGTGTEAGGFIGSDTYNSHSNFFVDSHVTGLDVTCAEGTSQTVGGFIAWNNGTTSAGTVKGFDGCSAAGTIKGANGIYGGFAGQVGGRACEYNNVSADVDITSTGTAGGFAGATQAYSTHKYTFNNCEASGDVSGNVAGGFVGKNGMSGDGKSVFVELNGCSASGSVTGTEIAGGLIGEVNTELPATNWNTVDSAGALTLKGNTAATDVKGPEGKTGALIGYLDGVANVDAKEGNTVKVTLENNIPADGINVSDDTIKEDITVKSSVAQVKDETFESLEDAITAANAVEGGATVTLLKDVTLGEKLTISGNVTISGKHTITRDDTYTGTLFAVNAGAALTLDNDLIIDGGNNWTYKEGAPVLKPGGDTYMSEHVNPAEDGINATAYLIENFGTLNVNKVTIQNQYSTYEAGVIKARTDSITTIDGATIQHIASNNCGAVVQIGRNNVTSTNATLTIKGDTCITENMGAYNGGIIIMHSQGNTFNFEGGSIDNNYIVAAGTVIMSWCSTSTNKNTVNMSGGIITKNKAEGYGPMYIHTNTDWIMSGGEISENISYYPNYVRSNNTATITGGTIVNNTLYIDYAYTQIAIASASPAEISGGTFTQDVTKWLAVNTGLVYNAENGQYTTTEDIAEVNGTNYKSIAEAISAAKAGDTVKVLASHKVNEAIVIEKNVTIDLNNTQIIGKEVYPVFRIQGNANVTVKNGNITNADYVFVLGASDSSSAGNLTIESGKYHGDTTVASVTKGTLTIKGGEFSVDPYEESHDFLLNCIDANYKDGSAKIVVKGGTFHKFNPSDNAAENPKANFVADGYKVTNNEDVFTVEVDSEKAVAQMNGVYYPTLAEAVAAANAIEGGATVELMKNATVGEVIDVTGNVVIKAKSTSLMDLVTSDDGDTITYAEGYNGKIFNVTETGSLKLEKVVLDGGAEWTANNDLINAEKEAGGSTEIFKSGMTAEQQKTAAFNYIKLDENAVVATDRMISVAGNLNMSGVTVKNFAGETAGIGIILATGEGNVEIKDGTVFEKIFAWRVGGDDHGGIIRVDSGKATLDKGVEIKNNVIIGANGSLIGVVDGVVDMSCDVTGNVAVNSNGLIQASGYDGTVPEIIIDGGMLSNNTIIPGVDNGFASVIYNRNGEFTMNAGVIKDNIGGSWPAFNMRYATVSKFNGGTISGNISMSGSEYTMHLRGGATVGTDMNITGNVDVYGGSDPVTNAGIINGDVRIRFNGTFENTGEVTGKIDIPTNYNVVLKGNGVYGIVDVPEGATLTIYEGTFSQDVNEYVAEGYEAYELENGVWTVKEESVARIGKVFYGTLEDAIKAAKDGETITVLTDIDRIGKTDSIVIAKEIIVDLGGKTLTTYGTYGGIQLKNGCTLKNGTLNHKGTVTAIKAWTVAAMEDLDIVVDYKAEGKVIGGIVIQENATGIGTIKNVKITGDGLTKGIETYNCGNATEPVIGSMENVTIDAVGTGMNISAPCGTATNCNIKGGTSGIEIWIKGTYSAILNLEKCTVKGGKQAVYAHDEFNSNPSTENKGILKLTVDEATKIVNPDGAELVLTIARAENVNLDDVIEKTVAKVGDSYYVTLAEAVKYAKDGEQVTLLDDVTLPDSVTINTDIILDLNGKTITTAVTEGENYIDAFIVLANVEVIDETGEGSVDARPSRSYAFYVGEKEGKEGNLTIKSGNFYGDTSAVQVSTGSLTVNGGYFEGVEYNGAHEFTLNCLDTNYKNGTAKIEVKGGTFYKFNPENNAAEGKDTNFVAEGYVAYELEEDMWTVKEDLYVAQIGDNKYESLAEALAVAKNGETVCMVADHTDNSAATIIPAGVTLDLNGKVVGASNVLAFGNVIDTADVVGGIKISNNTEEAIVHLQEDNGGYLPVYDTTVGCYRFFEYTVKTKSIAKEGDNKAIIKFALEFKNVDAYKVIANTENDEIDIIYELSWTGLPEGKTLSYSISDTTIKKAYEAMYNYVQSGGTGTVYLTLTVSGISKLNSGDILTATPKVESETGFVETSATIEPFVIE